jgi:hypothetical protein
MIALRGVRPRCFGGSDGSLPVRVKEFGDREEASPATNDFRKRVKAPEGFGRMGNSERAGNGRGPLQLPPFPYHSGCSERPGAVKGAPILRGEANP